MFRAARHPAMSSERRARRGPTPRQALDPLQVGAVGQPGAIPGADRDANDEVRGDITLDQGAQHTNLSSPPSAAPGYRECRLIAPPVQHDTLSLCKYLDDVYGRSRFRR